MAIYSAAEVAGIIDEDERLVRSWAGRNQVSRVGPAYAFTDEDLAAIADHYGVELDDDDETEELEDDETEELEDDVPEDDELEDDELEDDEDEEYLQLSLWAGAAPRA